MLVTDVQRIAQDARAERDSSTAALLAQQNSLQAQMEEKGTKEKNDFDAFRKTLDNMDLDEPIDVSSLV